MAEPGLETFLEGQKSDVSGHLCLKWELLIGMIDDP